MTLFDFLSLKNDVNVPSKNCVIHGPADPDPPKNVMDPQHWLLVLTFEAALDERLDSVLVYILLPRPRVVHKIVRERFIRSDPGLQDIDINL